MKYSLVLHAHGPAPKDYKVYLTDTESVYDKSKNWWKIGMLQNIRFEATVDSTIPSLSMDTIGLTVHECEKPDFSDGIIIFIVSAISIGEKKTKTLTTDNVLIMKGQKATQDDISIGEQNTPLGAVQKVVFEASVNGDAKLELQGITSKQFDVENFTDWIKDLPYWVSFSKKNIDELREVGTDGVIHRVVDNG